jgi:dolichyl-phosphate-mannose--protein O-mannosyl transferase
MAANSGKQFLGFPLEGFGFFTSLLLAFASAFFAFFLATTVAIFALLAWNLIGGHSLNYALSYRCIGFPVGVAVLVVALPLFGTLWFKARLRGKN